MFRNFQKKEILPREGVGEKKSAHGSGEKNSTPTPTSYPTLEI